MLSLSSTNRNPLQSTYTLTPGKRTTGEAPVETHDESADPDTLHPSPSAATWHLLSLVGVDDRALSEASGATPLSAPDVASEEYFRAGDRFLKLQRLDNSGEDSQPAIGHVEARLPTGGRDILREQTMVAFYEGARSDGWMTQTTSSSAKASLPAVTIHEHQTIEGGRYEITAVEQPSEIVTSEDITPTEDTKMNITTKATPQDNTTAAKVAQAAQRYARRASSMAPSVGGIGAAALAGGVGAIANRSSLSSEAARELLRENQGKLGGVMESALRSAAGPVR